MDFFYFDCHYGKDVRYHCVKKHFCVGRFLLDVDLTC